ncbi:major facilitator superfamily MFS_1 [Emticicia oligotrophica DSM 17448]|uniref:Major facilitator superfamily MFS_1 n=1 Tax=Emticicia oligotrophica (strain DSM 17448 / CIP 109782 / MTCC 6937 / GPTSA100-15) TaxID=929562 RepID=A0ABM5MX87_EMTOG|nr:MFS transporter [Emticicia oligotrophica]AFK01731.1 major facilitator superfamily MFS_1 [Emticicia oligotrophica DSM 17448]
MVNQSRLFLGSCFALITTAFSFSIRAGILPQLGTDFNLTAEQLGFINSMWFLGFPLAMIIGGLVYHSVGPKKIMMIAFVSHALGIILTIYSGGYTGLLISTFFIGLGNGCTEAACNPMIADAYSGTDMSKMLNRFHMWFPGGIVIGSLLSKFMTDAGMSWQAQIWLILIPTIIYAYLFWGQAFPKPKVEGVTSIGENLKAMATPLYIFMFLCMALTAISEFGPQQWTGLIMSKSGASPMLILALVTGLMAVIRFFAGPIVEKFDQTGVLLGSSIFAAIGIYLFSTQTGSMAYVAAIFFALGVALFWPNMVGFVAEKVPLSGALGMSIIGGVGMFSTAIFQPIIGSWIDDARAQKTAEGLTGDALELAAGQATLSTMVLFPAILIVAFTGLYFFMKTRKTA